MTTAFRRLICTLVTAAKEAPRYGNPTTCARRAADPRDRSRCICRWLPDGSRKAVKESALMVTITGVRRLARRDLTTGSINPILIRVPPNSTPSCNLEH